MHAAFPFAYGLDPFLAMAHFLFQKKKRKEIAMTFPVKMKILLVLQETQFVELVSLSTNFL